MLDREWKAIEVKSNVRYNHRVKEVYTKVFDESLFTLEAPSHISDMGLSRLMRKVVFFDLLYLKEFKQVTYKSDFDELQFVVQLILDLTKIIGEREPSLSQLFNENLR